MTFYVPNLNDYPSHHSCILPPIIIVANINIHKLDAAFDIDPLFHKMSKTFDEGGAKGLLLANLGVSNKGCNIVFDSTLEEVANNDDESDTIRDQSNSALVDVSSLQGRIEVALAGQMLDRLPLVPQLAMLREEYRQLDQDGFLEPQVPTVSLSVIDM